MTLRFQLQRRPLNQLGRQLLFHCHTQLLELGGLFDQVAAAIDQLTHGAVVAVTSTIQSGFHLLHAFQKQAQLVVELLGTAGQLSAMTALIFKAP